MPNLATDATATQFDGLYLKSQPPAVQNLMKMPGGMNRVQTAAGLAEAGYLIDNTIMVQAWSPYWTTKSRLAYGYTWVPTMLMPPIQIAPNLNEGPNGPPPYDAGFVPPGALIVTLDMDLIPHMFPAPKAHLAPPTPIAPVSSTPPAPAPGLVKV